MFHYQRIFSILTFLVLVLNPVEKKIDSIVSPTNITPPQTGKITRVSVASDLAQANNQSGFGLSTVFGSTYSVSISPDGRFVAFSSDASNLVANDTNGTTDVFVKDLQTNNVSRVSLSSSAAEGNGPSTYPSISRDGKFVSFVSFATNLVEGDTNNSHDVFVRDIANAKTVRVSVSSAGVQQNPSWDDTLQTPPVISADGRFVAFYAEATTLVDGVTGGVFVHDLGTKQTTLASIGQDGNARNTYCPSISEDGRLVVSTNDLIYVRDRVANQTIEVNPWPEGTGGGGLRMYAALSETGQFLVYYSWPDVLNIIEPGKTAPQKVMTVTAGDNMPAVSNDGKFVSAFFKNDLGFDGIISIDRQSGDVIQISEQDGIIPANGHARALSMSSDGRFIAFVSDASNLVSDDTNGVMDVFVWDRLGTRYDITGQITDGSNHQPVSGVVVQAGPDLSAITDADGNYRIRNFYGGPLTLTPSKSGSSFRPASQYVDGPADWTGVNFEQTGFIDVSISLYRTPSAADQAAYEGIIGYFADAIYEMSNGAQHLRSVTVFTNGENADRANIIWSNQEHPCSIPAGYGYDGLHVYFGDHFYTTIFLLSQNWKSAGYTLGHEWGHYYYGLYDEYRGHNAADNKVDYMPHTTDVVTPYSIMNSQWNAVSGDFRWLNFSVIGNLDPAKGKQAQTRVYKAFGWDTIARPVSWDPQRRDAIVFPQREYYPELSKVAPAKGQNPSLELGKVSPNVSRAGLQKVIWSVGANSAAATASPSGFAYHAVVRSLSGDTIPYPQSVLLYASVSRVDPIAKAGLVAKVTAPDQKVSALTMKDDGVAPDAIAEDGFYSGIMPYNQNGTYLVSVALDNLSGLAYFSEGAAAHSLGPNGETYTATKTLVGEAFATSASTSVQISGYKADDHSDIFQTGTVLPPNNEKVAGRIDRAADLDLFKITPKQNGMLVIRVTDLVLGMLPHLRIIGADGKTILKDLVLGPDGYLMTKMDGIAGQTIYAEVSHQNRTSPQGGYFISAGSVLPSDTETKNGYQIFLPVLGTNH